MAMAGVRIIDDTKVEIYNHPNPEIKSFLTTVELSAPATLDQLLRCLNLPETKIIFVNGIAQSEQQHPLHQGDEIAVFPLVGGG